MPAPHPGARPPRGASIDPASTPPVVSDHETTEFEFHISPAESSSRPQTGVGTRRTASSTSRAVSSLSVRSRGLSTASAASGMLPASHTLTS